MICAHIHDLTWLECARVACFVCAPVFLFWPRRVRVRL